MLMEVTPLPFVPEFTAFGTMLKARAGTEGAERVIYIEASNEGRDYQGEIVLAKALEDSATHFLRYGNLDIDHKTMPSVAKAHGITNPQEWEIGMPIAAQFERKRTFVKARLYQGDTPLAARANMVWDSLTQLSPPKRWYPSVGGIPLGAEARIDPMTKARVHVITKVRWSNLALAAEPVNQHVPSASTTPIGVFAKSLGGFVIAKDLTAGYGTDSAALTGGGALREQSLDGRIHSYWDFREKVSAAIRSGKAGKNPGVAEITDYATKKFALQPDEAAEWVERFMRDLKTGINKQRSNP